MVGGWQICADAGGAFSDLIGLYPGAWLLRALVLSAGSLRSADILEQGPSFFQIEVRVGDRLMVETPGRGGRGKPEVGT